MMLYVPTAATIAADAEAADVVYSAIEAFEAALVAFEAVRDEYPHSEERYRRRDALHSARLAMRKAATCAAQAVDWRRPLGEVSPSVEACAAVEAAEAAHVGWYL